MFVVRYNRRDGYDGPCLGMGIEHYLVFKSDGGEIFILVSVHVLELP